MRPGPAKRVLAFVLVSFASKAAAAEPVDCLRLKSTKTPFELRMGSGENLVRTQVTRLDGLRHSVVSVTTHGEVDRWTMEANFDTSLTTEDNVINLFLYSVPTNRYSFDTNLRDDIVTLSTVGVKMDIVAQGHYDYFPDANLRIGKCEFLTKHYRYTLRSELATSVREIWFSPELQAVLRETTPYERRGQMTETTKEATAILMKFELIR